MTTLQPHAHQWKVDGQGLGACSVPGCGEERQFKNTWTPVYRQRLERPVEQVAGEMAALHGIYHAPGVSSPHRITRPRRTSR